MHYLHTYSQGMVLGKCVTFLCDFLLFGSFNSQGMHGRPTSSFSMSAFDQELATHTLKAWAAISFYGYPSLRGRLSGSLCILSLIYAFLYIAYALVFHTTTLWLTRGMPPGSLKG